MNGIIEMVLLVLGGAYVLAYFIGLFAMLSPFPDHVPMAPDEEIAWLMRDHGMPREEAEELVGIER